jgi:hypothetical protein
MSHEQMFDELRGLQPGWDSYGAPPISEAAIQSAQAFLSRMDITPCSDGGVQLEWHTYGFDLEVEFHPNGTVEVWHEAAPPSVGPSEDRRQG